MITCRELADHLFAFVAGELPPDRREPIEAHLQTCSCCSAFLESYRTTITIAGYVPREPLPQHLLQRLQALLEENGKGQGGRACSE